jgi:hypothetical protein
MTTAEIFNYAYDQIERSQAAVSPHFALVVDVRGWVEIGQP